MITDASYGTENQCFNLNFIVLTNFEILQVPARQLPAYPMDDNPLRFSEMDKKYRSTGKERKLETTSERRCPEVDERKKGFPTTSSKRP